MSDTTLNKPMVDDGAAAPPDQRQQGRPDAGMLRHAIRQLEPALAEHHREERRSMMRQAAAQLAWQDPRDILRQLASDYGMSWTAISRMVGVSPTAVRKWRKGEPISADARESLAGVLAFLQHAESCQPISDVGRWLEMRVVSESWLTPIDLYTMGARDLLLDWLGEYISVDEMLGSVDPAWRTNYARDAAFAVKEGPDGERAIVPRK